MRLACAKTGRMATRAEDKGRGMSGLGAEAGVSSDKVWKATGKGLDFILGASLCSLPKWP